MAAAYCAFSFFLRFPTASYEDANPEVDVVDTVPNPVMRGGEDTLISGYLAPEWVNISWLLIFHVEGSGLIEDRSIEMMLSVDYVETETRGTRNEQDAWVNCESFGGITRVPVGWLCRCTTSSTFVSVQNPKLLDFIMNSHAVRG